MEPVYVLAATTGCVGGFGHCIGMCGPFIASSALRWVTAGDASRAHGNLAPQLFYHAGRLTTYGIVGAIMGLAGSFVNVAGKLAGIQNGVMVVAGIVMVVMGLGILGVVGGTHRLEQHNAFILRTARKLFHKPVSWKNYPLGLIMGLMPCGLSYTAFIAAAGAGAPTAGLFTMLSFGAGTVPALAFFGMAMTYLGSRLRASMLRAGGATVTIMGLYYVLRGIRLYVEM